LVALGQAMDRAARAEKESGEVKVQWEKCREDLEGLEEEREALRRQMDAMRVQLESEREDLKRVVAGRGAGEGRVAELMALVSSLESSGRAAAQKYNLQSARLVEAEETVTALRQEVKRLEAEVADRDKRLVALQDSLRLVDEDRDLAQSQVDALESERRDWDKVRVELERRVRLSQSAVDTAERRVSDVMKEVASSQRAVREWEGKANALEADLREARNQLAARAAEVGGASRDLQALVGENQALTSELSQACAERSALRKQTVELTERLTDCEDALRYLNSNGFSVVL